MRYLLATLLALVLVAILEAARQIYRWTEEKRSEELRRRLQSLGQDAEPGVSSLLRDQRLASSPFLDELLRSLPLVARVDKLLQQTDVEITVAKLLGWTLLAGCGGLLVALLVGLGPFSLVVAAAASSAPTAGLLVSRARRSNRVSEQLPEALEMLSRSLRAGHALSGAFETVAKEMPAPVAIEFGRVFESQRLGMSLEESLLQVVERVPGNGDVKMLTVSVTIQRETGGNLAEIFGNLAETIRGRYRFFGKLRGLTAEGRASAVILGALPFVVAAVLQATSPGYLVPLVRDPTGQLVLAYACASWIVGLLWLKRMTMLDY